jgi:hypothetical protein
MDILNISISFVQRYLQVNNESISTPSPPTKQHRKSDVNDAPAPSIPDIAKAEFEQHVKYVNDRFLRAIAFVSSGLKASARAAEFPALGILASNLEGVEVGVR